MTNKPISKVIAEIKAAAELPTALNLATAESVDIDDYGYIVCPVCEGDGGVHHADYCNIDHVALGVSFYGIGEEFGLAEKYFRAVSPVNVKRLIDHITELEQQLAAERERLEAYDRAAKEPVLYCMACEGNLDTESISESKSVVDSWVDEWNSPPRSSGQPTHKTIPLFPAPPLPVVPDEVPESLKVKLIDICDLVENNDEYCQDIWKACLAAMLQSGQFRDATKMIQLSGNSDQFRDATKMVADGNSQSSISSSNSTGCGVNACNQSSKGDA